MLNFRLLSLNRLRQREHQEKLEAEVLRLQSEIALFTNQIAQLREENEIVRRKQLFLRYFLQEVVAHAIVDNSKLNGNMMINNNSEAINSQPVVKMEPNF
jgi:hypothetical protein